MAPRTGALHSPRSAYLHDLTNDDATGLFNWLFDDQAAAPPVVPVAPKISRVTTSPGTSPPSTSTSATATALYLREPGDTSAISVNDIHQGQLGDCFLLASIGEIALWHPDAIMNMICTNVDGTETVSLYLAAGGQLPTRGTTSFEPTTVTVNNTFPSDAVNNGATQDVVNGVKEIWVQVLENAVATLGGGYSSIATGSSPIIAMEELDGQHATRMSPDSLTLQTLQADWAAGDLIVMDTPATGILPYNLVNKHAYMFESVNVVNGTPMVQLGNPWGFNQPQAIPLSQLSSSIVEVDVGQFAAGSLITGAPGDNGKTLSAPVTDASFDLGAGNDTLALANGTNSATVANAGTVIGGTGDDTIVLATAANHASIDLGAGNDSLTFGDFTNFATGANVETMTGGSGNDTITLGDAMVNGSVDLGGGIDTLVLANFTNRVSVANTENVFGGSGNDTIILTGSAATSVVGGAGMNFITGNSAADQFVFNQNGYGNITWLTNFNSAKGDTIALDTSTYDFGGAAITPGVDLVDVADWAARIATTLANGGKGGLLYEQDTGELFYSANGSFVGGNGTQIGIVTSNGSTPWRFDANSFVQV